MPPASNSPPASGTPLASASASVGQASGTPEASRSEALASILQQLPLDEDSLDLVATMDPDEQVQVIVLSVQPPAVSKRFRDGGFQVLDVGEQSTLVEGRLDRLLDTALHVQAMSILVREADEALRPIPTDRPAVEIPTPGTPYVGGFGDLEMPEVEMPEPQRTLMLGSFASSIVTIDGQPFRQAEVSAGCDQDGTGLSCSISTAGWIRGGGAVYDDWQATGNPATGWRAVVNGRVLSGVPRPLRRAAEWIARHDEPTLRRIDAFETCCDATWDPEHPGQIALFYQRPCQAAVAEPGQAIASTGDCFDQLRVLVDIPAGTVLSIDENAGP